MDNPHTKPFAFWEWLVKALLRREQARHGPTGGSVHQAQGDGPFGGSRASPRATPISPGGSSSTGPKASGPIWKSWPHGPVGRLHAAELLAQHAGHPVGAAPGRAAVAFALRYVLAATLSPSYGVYSGYELCENVPASADNEEYLGSEKFEIKHRDFSRPGRWPRCSAPSMASGAGTGLSHRCVASISTAPITRRHGLFEDLRRR